MKKQKWKPNLSILRTFSFILFGFIIYIFYASELRERLENILFDYRTRVKPSSKENTDIQVLCLNEHDLHSLKPLPKSADHFVFLLSELQKSTPKAIVLLIPHHDLDYESPGTLNLFNYMRQNPNIYLGIFEYHETSAHLKSKPQNFSSVLKIYGANTFKNFRQQVIRSYPIASYFGEDLEWSLPVQVALDLSSPSNKNAINAMLKEKTKAWTQTKSKKNLPQTLINFRDPQQLNQIQWGHIPASLNHKIVLIGYDAFRKRDITFLEGSHINTPWEGEEGKEEQGVPFVKLISIVLENLLSGSWLREASLGFTIVQTTLSSGLCFLVWKLNPSLAVSLFMLILASLSYLNSLLFAYLNLYIPLADCFLFSTFSALLAAFRKSSEDSRRRLKKSLALSSQEELSAVQGKFLNLFSFELSALNQRIAEIFNPKDHKYSTHPQLVPVQKIYQSSLELKDYLAGIKQYALLSSEQSYEPRISKLNVNLLVQRLLNQFELLIAEAKVRISIDNPVSAYHVLADEVLLEPILFNLISNAIKYSRHEGLIKIGFKKTHRKKLCISIQDHGQGMSAEFHEKIFEKFYRIKNDQVYSIKGHGLGLYLCQYFAEKMQSKITVQSQLGQGSTFSIELNLC